MRAPDVAIVGGGIIGLATALELSRAGLKPLVIERGRPAGEASTAAAGILAPLAEAHAADAFFALGLESRELWRTFAASLEEASGTSVGFETCGALKVAFDETSERELRDAFAWQQAAGVRSALLDEAGARALEPGLSPSVRAALHLPEEAQVDTRRAASALVAAVRAAGIEIRAAAVKAVHVENGRACGVELANERLQAGAVVLAAGAWTGILPGSGLREGVVRPARGQLVQYALPTRRLRNVVFAPGGYLVPRADGRIIAGATLEFVGFDKSNTEAGLRHVRGVATRVLPELETQRAGDWWAGLRPYAEDHLPVVGPGKWERLFVATGHFRNGILLAPVTAQRLAALVLGRRAALDAAVAPARFAS